eukprot:3538584-Pleurochrysis_carterae.AAC.1
MQEELEPAGRARKRAHKRSMRVHAQTYIHSKGLEAKQPTSTQPPAHARRKISLRTHGCYEWAQTSRTLRALHGNATSCSRRRTSLYAHARTR